MKSSRCPCKRKERRKSKNNQRRNNHCRTQTTRTTTYSKSTKITRIMQMRITALDSRRMTNQYSRSSNRNQQRNKLWTKFTNLSRKKRMKMLKMFQIWIRFRRTVRRQSSKSHHALCSIPRPNSST